jgi:hypothetical protein
MSWDRHKHHWIYVELGIGTYQKGEQNIHFDVPGMLCKCVCDILMFFPDSKDLRPVEVSGKIVTSANGDTQKSSPPPSKTKYQRIGRQKRLSPP